jgi:hypothetical protein
MSSAYHEGSCILWNFNKAFVRKQAAMTMISVLNMKMAFIAFFCLMGRLRRLVMTQGRRIA